nr:HlyD family type I secretion periplasmic adaptor subunit [Ruegeria atlantica]
MSVVALLLFMLIWAYFTEIDDVTRAEARVVPSKLVQVVQAPETGTITEINVREGDVVDAGNVLMRFDPVLLRAELDSAVSEATALRLRRARLEAQIYEQDFELIDMIESEMALFEAERNLFNAMATHLAADLAVLDSRRKIKLAEIEAARTNKEVNSDTIELLEEEIGVIQPLVERRIESPLVMIGLRRELSRQNGQLSDACNRMLIAQAALAEIDSQIIALKREFKATANRELTEAQARLVSLETRIPALQARLARAEIRAPARGVVNQVLISTLGGVAHQGQTLVEIVPFGETVTVEAFVTPDDIAFVRPDQDVKVRITAYDASRYGTLNGSVTRIGADTVLSPDGETSVYVVGIELGGVLTDADGQQLDIIPGMVAQVDMLSEPKTILEYLIKPVFRVKDRAFRD